jgi:molybdopterin molybdotransferase
MIPYADALSRILTLPTVSRTERRPLSDAIGRILAEDVALSGDQPPFDRATMDGFAVVPDGGSTFRVVGTVVAGSGYAGALRPGEAVRIMTGAPCPEGATVVPIELTTPSEDQVEVGDAAALAPGRHVARRGEDGRRGDVVVPAGTRLTPQTLAAAAMCGAREVAVQIPPRVAIVTTGDEVGGSGDGAILDSNGPFLVGFCATLGLPVTRAHARDTHSAVAQALGSARAAAEVVVTSGGVSGSDADHVPSAASAEGFSTIFHHVAMQPGKPVLLARHPHGQLLVGLPGNPVSILATAHLVLLPVLGRLLGGWSWRWRVLPLTVPWRNRSKRQLFLPARLADGGVEPIAWNGSGDLIAAAAGDGLIDLAPGAEFARGAPVRFLSYLGDTTGGTGVIPPRTR